MAILRIDCGAVETAASRDLDGAAARAGPHGPTVVMIHGYRYDPATPCACPHSTLYAAAEVAPARSRGGRILSWPRGLGFGGGGAGLGVAYGWGARAATLGAYWREGRNGFAATHEAAEGAGAALAPLLRRLAGARDAPVDLYAHSLGGRVALAALRRLAAEGDAATLRRIGRLLLLGPAEHAATARATMAACDAHGGQGVEVYCLLSRRNAAFDRLFEAFGPWGRGPALGRAGLGGRRAGWIDLAFDHPDLPAWAAARGAALAPAGRGPCHWDFYTRPGAMALHRAILTRAPGFGAEEMRLSGAPLFGPRRAWIGWRPPTLGPGPAAPAAA